MKGGKKKKSIDYKKLMSKNPLTWDKDIRKARIPEGELVCKYPRETVFDLVRPIGSRKEQFTEMVKQAYEKYAEDVEAAYENGGPASRGEILEKLWPSFLVRFHELALHYGFPLIARLKANLPRNYSSEDVETIQKGFPEAFEQAKTLIQGEMVPYNLDYEPVLEWPEYKEMKVLLFENPEDIASFRMVVADYVTVETDLPWHQISDYQP